MSISDVAVSGFFGVCVPAASDGRLEQTLSPERVVPLSAEDRELYDPKDAEAWKIETDLGLVVLEIEKGWCRIFTCEGNPKEALQLFREQVQIFGGWEEGTTDQGDGYFRTNAMLPLRDGWFVGVFLVAKMEDSNAGFFMSAVGVQKN